MRDEARENPNHGAKSSPGARGGGEERVMKMGSQQSGVGHFLPLGMDTWIFFPLTCENASTQSVRIMPIFFPPVQQDSSHPHDRAVLTFYS